MIQGLDDSGWVQALPTGTPTYKGSRNPCLNMVRLLVDEAKFVVNALDKLEEVPDHLLGGCSEYGKQMYTENLELVAL